MSLTNHCEVPHLIVVGKIWLMQEYKIPLAPHPSHSPDPLEKRASECQGVPYTRGYCCKIWFQSTQDFEKNAKPNKNYDFISHFPPFLTIRINFLCGVCLTLWDAVVNFAFNLSYMWRKIQKPKQLQIFIQISHLFSTNLH